MEANLGLVEARINIAAATEVEEAKTNAEALLQKRATVVLKVVKRRRHRLSCNASYFRVVKSYVLYPEL